MRVSVDCRARHCKRILPGAGAAGRSGGESGIFASLEVPRAGTIAIGESSLDLPQDICVRLDWDGWCPSVVPVGECHELPHALTAADVCFSARAASGIGSVE